jgi:hypothetical protein
VLASFELSSDSSDGEQQLAPAREREQLRRIHLRNKGGLTLRASGVHVRRDIGDESADVDIATTDGEPLAVSSTPPGASTAERPSQPAHFKIHSPRPTRFRRPPPIRPPVTTKAKILSEHDNKSPSMLPPAAKKEKPKSETYKQAWSVSEQHLLERLLSEIPDGEKNRYEILLLLSAGNMFKFFFLSRWSKISKAMGGRRTPRQVASRVQKYFEKLKLFGVNVERA